ncbi:S49 family peptidase [Salmonella enterica]|nr:S49 family peptidase [Salmonella enterica]EDX2042544.1 S49 family peptidase [Salmonella enterica subsp. houtenae serovar 50:z4,z23:-]HCZ1711949.1 S49 family peptidase [Salmonella enterica subsp. enterica serovar Montevideo str. 0269]EAB1814864.1 S49 family peptidase [Salmonella enterica]EAM8826370.1 S49 family peptidase [Salmonella enterica]
MTPELRNLPHIASMAFNEPLMLEPAYARVFFCALAGQLGITRLTDAASGITLGAEQIAEPLALFGDDEDMGSRPSRSYQVTNGIAVLPVSGTLVSKTRSLQPYSGMTGYNGIIARLQQAMSDPGVEGILLDMDTPGGMVSGAFDCADIIARMRDIKPIWALANDMNCSAGQLIASAASRQLVTQTARTGSIGVMMAHSNYGAALKTNGVEVTLIYSGDHKVDGNPYEKLPKDVRTDFQTRIDATRQMFAEKVSAYTGMSVQAVLDTEAAVFSGQESVDVGLADELVNNTEALNVMRDALNKRKIITTGGNMTHTTAPAATTQPSATPTATQTTASTDPVITAEVATEIVAAPADVSALVSAAVVAENCRIMGILNCEEAKGRDTQARVLAETPGMTVESAQRILAAAPQSAQARTDTALDRLMEAAPGALSAGNASAETGDDLLNTPV